MTLRRIALFLTLMLVTPLAIVASAPSAQAAGKRTQKWDTGYFKASITVDWTSKHDFSVKGWLEDTKCDSRGVYLNSIYTQRKKPGGGFTYGSPQWGIGYEDDDGCNNGKFKFPKILFTAGKKKVPMLRVPVIADDKKTDDDELVYAKVWKNPFVDG